MTLNLLSGPTAEPIDLADAKLHLRVEGAAEDSLINGLIAAARLSVEASARVALINQTWVWKPADTRKGDSRFLLDLPLGPVLSIVAITVEGIALSPSEYSFTPGLHAQISLGVDPDPSIPSSRWPDIEVTFVAGFGALSSDVPRDLRHAVTMLVAHWFENREPAGLGEAVLPGAVLALLMPYRKIRL